MSTAEQGCVTALTASSGMGGPDPAGTVTTRISKGIGATNDGRPGLRRSWLVRQAAFSEIYPAGTAEDDLAS